MRYAWDQFDIYFGPAQVGKTASLLMHPVMDLMARWDRTTARRVDRFLANSQYVAGRIGRYYNRRSTIVYPPVDTDYYTPEFRSSSRSFLIVSALVPYKRLDVAIEACRQLSVPLTIVGTGPEAARLRAMAGPDVQFLGWQPDERIRELYRSSGATILPGTEDFGIVPVESQACGTPVVALDDGGARETVIDGATGVLVPAPTAEAFAEGLSRAMRTDFDPAAARRNALRFSRQQFMASFRLALEEAIVLKHGETEAARVPPPQVPGDHEKYPQTPGGPWSGARDGGDVPKGSRAVDFDAASVPPPSVEADRKND